MRVLFDALGLPPYGGAKSSALGWIRSVVQQHEDHHFVVLVSPRQPALDGFANLVQVEAPSSGRFAVRAWAQARIRSLVRKNQIDLVHFTKNLGCLFVPCRTVITINDLNRLHYPAMFSRVDLLYWKTVQHALLGAMDRVIAISENTKRDLVQFYNLPPDRIQVIYPAVDARFHHPDPTTRPVSEVLDKYGLQQPYILSVGGMAQHKNVYTALRAFLRLAKQDILPNYSFVIVGERFHTHNDRRLLELASRHGDERVQFAGVVADEDLPSLYTGASLFVYPSLYEGFGLAPIEAMACGVPVLASRSGSLPEVLQEAAWTVADPTDPDAIAEGMQRLLTDASIWQRFRQQGLDNARRFQWSRTARQTFELYQGLAPG